MSNSSNTLNSASRAMLVGAMAGGSATVVKHWQEHRDDVISTDQLVRKALTNSVKTAAIAGATTHIAEKMAGRPALSLISLLSVGAASLYLLDQYSDNNNE